MEITGLLNYDEMRQHFNSRKTAAYAFRIKQLLTLKKALKLYEHKIIAALHKDLHKSPEESYLTEIGFVYNELAYTMKHLKKWMRISKVGTPFFLFPSSSYLIKEPLGICLIVAPWNYPFQLLMAPLIGAIAGGNCVVLKPSEVAANTSTVIAEMIGEFFNSNYVQVIEGDGSIVVPQLMAMHTFDHVFFTGSVAVGKVVARLAAEKLVTTTLELGGKSPCIVDEDANIQVAAKRISWGKFTNAGQTCVAPDYLLVHEKIKDAVVAELTKSIVKFFGDDPKRSVDFGRIISNQRLLKLQSYLTMGTVITGGDVDVISLYFSPTLMHDIDMKTPLMQDEVFGPILPIITYKINNEALSIINKNPSPLSLYYFGSNPTNQHFFTQNIRFGGGCINNTLVQLANTKLPFGGVQTSGMGAYHGKYSFETFTRKKSIVKTKTWVDPSIKYPPYKGRLNLFRWLFK